VNGSIARGNTLRPTYSLPLLPPVSLRHDDALLQLTGQDDGPGIAATERNRVFERFYRGAGHAANGSGLGLAIVQQAVRRMGGQVKVGDGLNGKGVGFCRYSPPSQRLRLRKNTTFLIAVCAYSSSARGRFCLKFFTPSVCHAPRAWHRLSTCARRSPARSA